MSQLQTRLRVETRAVLAGAYPGRRIERGKQPMLTHSLVSDELSGKEHVLCGRVLVDSLADPYAGDPQEPPTCPRCLVKDNRFPRAHPPAKTRPARP
jgi:hypothetical protein